ncbi:hypothetical protein RQM65_13705 [Pricia sp. S334]|uniref:Uncharacterized protein n=1 Tax=Pricia mediterranea TaxID=3076079 RepID=A0ABU3L7J8_9FLAO|nr:hypothetical protein [Pricia sp. S334]MDT7829724.1 hypothetical protein [Pricia sp. S334]
MFSTGQIVFAVLFAIAFIILIIFTYKKDKKLHAKNYKGARWVAVVFIAFVLVLFILRYMLKY